MFMRFTSIASGSSGNCTYIGSERTHILMDAGVSKKRIKRDSRRLNWGCLTLMLFLLPMSIQTILQLYTLS